MKYILIYLPLILAGICFILSWLSATTEEKKQEVEKEPISPKVAFIKDSEIPWGRKGGAWKS